MRKRALFFAMTMAILSILTLNFNAQASKIVLANDDWSLSDSGFFAPNDPGAFAADVAYWFASGSEGNFLVYSSNFALTGSTLASAMTSAGHNWTVSTEIPFDLKTLSAYNGIFLAGDAVDTGILTDYVKAGGNVYLAGGTGWGGAEGEAARWNPFLMNFGLEFVGTSYNDVYWNNIAINNVHPIFKGVDSLYNGNGNDIINIMPNDPRTEVLVSYNGHGLYAVYDSDAGTSAPEPATILLVAIGLIGLMKFRRKSAL